LPPHQYVIKRRVERAWQLLRNGDLGLGEVALRVGFYDQSQFCFHFKRIIGITPGQFRTSARIAQKENARSAKNFDAEFC
jgi:AraC family transcriptional regulator